jgi:hypothetical protein
MREAGSKAGNIQARGQKLNGAVQGRNPKPEIRNPNEIRTPKSEARIRDFRNSDLGFRTSFGFLVSDFFSAAQFPATAPSTSTRPAAFRRTGR